MHADLERIKEEIDSISQPFTSFVRHVGDEDLVPVSNTDKLEQLFQRVDALCQDEYAGIGPQFMTYRDCFDSLICLTKDHLEKMGAPEKMYDGWLDLATETIAEIQEVWKLAKEALDEITENLDISKHVVNGHLNLEMADPIFLDSFLNIFDWENQRAQLEEVKEFSLVYNSIDSELLCRMIRALPNRIESLRLWESGPYTQEVIDTLVNHFSQIDELHTDDQDVTKSLAKFMENGVRFKRLSLVEINAETISTIASQSPAVNELSFTFDQEKLNGISGAKALLQLSSVGSIEIYINELTAPTFEALVDTLTILREQHGVRISIMDVRTDESLLSSEGLKKFQALPNENL